MDDQGAVYDFRKLEAVGIENTVGVSFVAKKGKQVSGMFRVRQPGRIIVISGFVKRKRAVACFMDVHSVELAVGRNIFVRQTVYFRFDQYTAKGNRIEICDSVKGRIVGIAGNLCVSAGI